MGGAARDLNGLLAQLEHESERTAQEVGDPALHALAREVRRHVEQLQRENAELRAEHGRLREVEANYGTIFSAAHDGIFVGDVETGTILEANQPACELLGYARDELIGIEVAAIHPYELPQCREFLSEVITKGHSTSYELACRAKSGVLIPTQMRGSAVTYEGRLCALIFVNDLRVHRLAELGEAVAKIGHDLRNILATAQLLSDRLTESADPLVQRVTPRLVGSIDRAISLCVDALAPAHIRQPPLRPGDIELRPLVEDAAATAGVTERGDVVWKNRVPTDLIIHADGQQVFRIVLNLVRNAAQAMTEGGEISVEAREENAATVIEVADTGPGLPDHVRDRLFQPFARGDARGGTGLGLTIARELAQAHGGAVRLASSGAEGTVFRIELPQAAQGRDMAASR